VIICDTDIPLWSTNWTKSWGWP